MIRVADLRHLARFRRPTQTVTRGDTTLEPFVETFTAWVDIQPVGMVENESGNAVQGARLSLVKMRYDARVHRQLTMAARGRDFEILSVIVVDENDRELQLQVRELA